MIQPISRTAKIATLIVALLLSSALIGACGTQETQFAVKHTNDETGKQITEIISHETQSGLDNSGGSSPLQIQIDFERTYKNQIKENITAEGLSSQKVREKIVELYKLPPNDPEGTEQTALCPISVVIPAGKKAVVTVEWTERWASGVINEGTEGSGSRLGTYRVFLGYIEPCSMVNQDNE